MSNKILSNKKKNVKSITFNLVDLNSITFLHSSSFTFFYIVYYTRSRFFFIYFSKDERFFIQTFFIHHSYMYLFVKKERNNFQFINTNAVLNLCTCMNKELLNTVWIKNNNGIVTVADNINCCCCLYKFVTINMICFSFHSITFGLQ